MRVDTKSTEVFPFAELSDSAKETAIQEFADVNVDYDWWDYLYEDAKTVGLIIEAFDLDRNRHCDAKWDSDADDCAKAILKEHGKSCETHVDATQYFADYAALVAKHSDGKAIDRVHEDNEYEFDEDCNELDGEFLKTICEDYSIMLQKEYEYLTGEEAITETIEANEYEFTVDGKQYR